MPILGPLSSPLPQQRPRGLPSAPAAVTPVASFTGSGTIAGASAGPGLGALTGSGTIAGAGAALAAGAAAFTGSGTIAGVSNAVFPVSVHASGRYLVRADGSPFLICADTTWSLFVDLPISGLAAYFSTLTSQGFNALMGNAIEHKFTRVKPPKNVAGVLPFTQRMDATSYTGSPNGTSSAGGTQGQFASDNYGSPSSQSPDCTFVSNTYWTTVEQILDAALASGLLVFVWTGYLGFHAGDEGWMTEMVVWDAAIGAGGFTGQPWADPTKSKIWNYGAWLANRWKAYPNIVWTMGGDYGTNTQTLSTPQRAAVVSLVAGMKSVSGQQSLLWTAHWDRPCISDDNLISGVTWDINACYTGEDVAEVCRRGYNTAAKPSMLVEDNYEAGSFGGTAPFRKYPWWGFLGGIAGGFYGHEQLWRFDNGSPGTDYTTLLATQGRLDAVRQFALLKSLPWHRMKPSGLGGMTTLVTAGGGTASPQSTDYVAAAATPEGDLLLAYIPPAHTGSITVAMTTMAATCRARWFDPTDSTFTAIGMIAATGTHAFTPPANNTAGDTDFLLVLDVPVAAFTGSGDFTATGAVIASGTGTLTGSGALAGAGAALAAGAAAFAGSGTIDGAGAGTAQGSSALSGSGAFAAVGSALSSGVSALAGSGDLAAIGAALAAGAGSFSGSGALTGTGAAIAAGVGVLSGTGDLLGQGASPAPITGAFTGSGTITGAGAAASGGAATGSFAGSGTIAGVSSALAAATGSFTGSSTIAGAGAALVSGTAAFTGSGSIAGVGLIPAAALTGSGTLAGAGARLTAGAASFSGTAQLQGASVTQAVPAVQTSMPAIAAPAGVRQTLSRFSATMSFDDLTSKYLLDNYLTGFKFAGSDGQELPPRWYDDKLANAIATLESITNIDVLQREVTGERHDYHCLVAGTLVETAAGPLPIEQVKVGDLVWTRFGLRRVTWSGVTGEKPTFDVSMSNGRVLTGTSEHPVWTLERGWVPLSHLTTCVTLLPWQAPARSATRNGTLNSHATRENKGIQVTDVRSTGRVEHVYDLTVEGAHEFFANGVLVHNSNDYLNYAFTKLFRQPAQSVQQVRAVYPTGQVIQVFPAEWVRLMPESGQIHLVPTSGSLAQVMLGGGNGYLPFIFAGLSYLPQLWEVDYVSGFAVDALPRDVAKVICKLAAIEIFVIMSDLIGPLGVASSSLGIDGMSQSIARQLPAFKARVDQYRVELGIPGPTLGVDPKYGGGEIAQLRRNYVGMVLASL